MNAGEFIRRHGGRRIEGFAPLSFMSSAPAKVHDNSGESELEFERPFDDWRPITPALPKSWRAGRWENRALRFVDGCDQGDTVIWMCAPRTGEPIPVRLSQIGATVIEVQDRQMRRVWSLNEKVVSLASDAFDWEEIEGFTRALGQRGFRLLSARPGGGQLSPDFEAMRIATQDRSTKEMTDLEEAALAWACEVPTILDGRLERCKSGFDARTSPVVGVVKTHRINYLHPAGLGLLYRLEPGQRTPAFLRRQERLSVVSWYVRLAGGAGIMPNCGYVRVEIAWLWFAAQFGDGETISPDGISHVDAISQLIYNYRCGNAGYNRAAISLEPIVQAEQKMKALLLPSGPLLSQFYRVCDL